MVTPPRRTGGYILSTSSLTMSENRSEFLIKYRASLFENRVVKRKRLEEKLTAERLQLRSENLSSSTVDLPSNQGPVLGEELIAQQDLYHGAFEDILMELKSVPFRRADAVRRSLRKRNSDVTTE